MPESRSARRIAPAAPVALGVRRGQVVGVRGRAESEDLGQRGRPALGGLLGVLEHQHRASFAHHEPVAPGVERLRDASRRYCLQARECGLGQRRQRRLRAARDDRVGVAVLDHPRRLGDRVEARRARRNGAERIAVQPVAHGQHAGGGVAHHQRHRQRRDLLLAVFDQQFLAVLERADAADAGPEHAPDAGWCRRAGHRGPSRLARAPRLRPPSRTGRSGPSAVPPSPTGGRWGRTRWPRLPRSRCPRSRRATARTACWRRRPEG